MEEKKIREERNIVLEITKEDTGTNRENVFSIKIEKNTTSLPAMTESELYQIKTQLDEYFKEKKVMTYRKMKESNYKGLYKIYSISELDGYFSERRALESIIFKCDDEKEDYPIYVGKGFFENRKKDYRVDKIYFYRDTLVELI